MTVLDGPFKGLLLPASAREEHIGPYLLGTYERELHGAWRKILTGQYNAVIDIGAKIGYYAGGLARHFPSTPSIAFDTDWWAPHGRR